MSEAVVYTGRAVVYYLDAANKSWASSGVAGYSRLDIYKNSANGTHRVIGRGLEDTSKVIINSMLTKDSNYNRVKETFHQFQDPQRTYGLNFAKKEDADTFAGHFEAAAGGGAAPPPAAKPAPQVAAKPAPPAAKKPPGTPTTMPVSHNTAAPGPPAPPGPPKAPPGPPPPPKKPAAPAGGGGDGGDKSALLSSITGFKGGLRKTETNDRSAPIVAASKPAAASRAPPPIHTASPSSGGGDDWETESEPAPPKIAAPKASMGGGMDMMSEMLKRQQSLKSSSADKAPVERQASQPTFKPPPGKLAAPTPVERSGSSPALQTPVKNGSLKREKPAPPPIAPRNEAPPVPAPREKALTPRGGSGTSTLSPELLALKEEIMAEVRLELEHMKEQIIAAIRDRS